MSLIILNKTCRNIKRAFSWREKRGYSFYKVLLRRKKFCNLCLKPTEKRNIRHLKPCHHEICRDCMAELITNNTKLVHNNKLKCPSCQQKAHVDVKFPLSFLKNYSLPFVY